MFLLNIFSGLIMAVVTLLYVIIFSFILWMAVDAGKQDKFWWIVIIFVLPIVGALAYYFTEKRYDYLKFSKDH